MSHLSLTRVRKATTGLLLVVALLTVQGCGGKPFKPERPGDMKPGPGLFTGKKGGIVLTPGS